MISPLDAEPINKLLGDHLMELIVFLWTEQFDTSPVEREMIESTEESGFPAKATYSWSGDGDAWWIGIFNLLYLF